MLRGVGRTALGVALLRAEETRRQDRLFDDPWAQAFLDAAPEAYPNGMGPGREALATLVVLRTWFYDDFLRAAQLPQVVILGAGLDTRAYRMAWAPGTRVFELDKAETLGFKNEVLAGAAPTTERVPVPVDLRAEWGPDLRAAGFDPDWPTAWLAEGLLAHPTADEADKLMAGVSGLSARGSQIAFEHGPAGTVVERPRAAVVAATAPQWKGGFGPDAAQRLTAYGWEPRFHSLRQIGAITGRPVSEAYEGGFLSGTYHRS